MSQRPGKTATSHADAYEVILNAIDSGELPPGTWETYAFNLGGASEVTFTHPVVSTPRSKSDETKLTIFSPSFSD